MGGGVFVVGSIFVSDSYSNTCKSIYSLSSIISNSPHIVTFVSLVSIGDVIDGIR